MTILCGWNSVDVGGRSESYAGGSFASSSSSFLVDGSAGSEPSIVTTLDEGSGTRGVRWIV